MADKRKVLVTGASGYIAGRMLPTFRERYELVLLDVKTTNRAGETVDDIQIADVTDPDRDKYRAYFKGVDAVVHCAFKGGSFENELTNVRWRITSTRPVWKKGCVGQSSVALIMRRITMKT